MCFANSATRQRVALAGAFLLTWVPLSARGDVVLDWNQATLDTIQAKRIPPPPATRLLAMVHAAVYDAVNGIEKTHQPYYVRLPSPPGASPVAAAAAAAHQVLTSLYSDRRDLYDGLLESSLASVKSANARNKGWAWGRFVGARIVKLRRNDGVDRVVPYEPSGELGRWEPTPPQFAPPLFPQWPYVTPFAMLAGDQFRVGPPSQLNSLDYSLAFLEVKELGEMDSPTRTDDQTQVAFFWEDGPGSATPPGHWQIIAREFAHRFDNSLPENARLFALLSIAQADAAIVSWDAKYHYDHWRPHTGILRADDDGNPDTDADPDWLPLIPTPPFPAYTSGHSTFSGASAEILALFFGADDIPFWSAAPYPQIWPNHLFDDEGHPVVRAWPSLSAAAEEAGQGRIYGGIHWQYDNQQGLASGRALAQYVTGHYLQPLD